LRRPLRPARLIAASLALLGAAGAARAQPVAFVHVNLIPMDRDHALADQTVLVRGDRIVAVGAAAAIAVSADATIVDGAGHYLLPGLVDAHVHLLGFGPVRATFADGPIYLANGITTVVNLGGPDTRAVPPNWNGSTASMRAR
jgi:cytosine/adenosine deaminase-related metal-dependent hydrolase